MENKNNTPVYDIVEISRMLQESLVLTCDMFEQEIPSARIAGYLQGTIKETIKALNNNINANK